MQRKERTPTTEAVLVGGGEIVRERRIKKEVVVGESVYFGGSDVVSGRIGRSVWGSGWIRGRNEENGGGGMEKMGEVLGGADEERSTCVLLWGEMVRGKGRASSRKMGGWGWKGLVCGCFVGRCWAVGGKWW